ncbi:MAG: PAS domain-containing protein [Treponema sp.]|jgi:two-component system phosphate regulon sensor histidine kinase PhoR|nr:PAS domain-containing protein [Treponema sp.]
MKTIFRKSLFLLTGITLFFFLSLGISVLRFMDSLYYETNTRNLRETARLLRSSLAPGLLGQVFEDPEGAGEEPEPGSQTGLQTGLQTGYKTWVQNLGTAGPYRVTFIDKDGRVIADSRSGPETMENHRGRPEVLAALEGREASARRNSASLGTELIYAALPVYDDPGLDQIRGVFRLALEVPNFQTRIFPAALPFILLTLLLFCLAFGAIYLFSKSLSRSFARLVGIAQSVHLQDTFPAVLSSPPLISDTEEFKTLERALKDMAAELVTRIDRARAEGSRLEAILNGMAEGVFAADEKLRLHLVNPRARALFGIPAGTNLAGLSLLEATHSTELEEAARDVLARGVPGEREITWHSTGVTRRFQVFAAAVPDIEGVVLVVGDITRLYKLEQVRKDFAANVSHELRTPIQIMKGFSETLLDSLPEDREQIRHIIGIIEKNARTMENLTNDLLSLVSLEDEESPRPDKEEFRISELLDEAVQSVEYQARGKNITIIPRCGGDLSARLYGAFIVQALVNLLDNAVKYSPPGSRIWAGASLSEGEPRELILTVKDEGIGIPAQHLDRIFERFYRVDKSGSREAGGTGLGLAIVRHIVLLHQGSVEAESHAGEGSTFRIRLPLNPNPGSQ